MIRRDSPRARYYVLYLREGDYEFESADDALDAQQALAYYKHSPEFVELGIYDPQDWCFNWSTSEEEQHKHLSQVSKLTDRLKRQYESRLR
ncbi:hypothetical protein [Spirosoma koreense]